MKKSTPDVGGRDAVIDWMEPRVNQLSDALLALWPRRRPPTDRLRRCRLISHRGVYDNRRVWENSFAAFDAAVACGAWGIECDVRWSRDQQAMVFHDPDFRRLAGSQVQVHDLTAAQIRHRWPQVPSLPELVARYGKRVHLMIELKEVPLSHADALRQRLAAALDGLAPGRDYHLLSLTPWVLDRIGHAHAAACVPIARERVSAFSDAAADGPYAGLCGHHLLLRTRIIRRHHRKGQGVGTGFSNIPKALYREVNRGVDWIFTDRIRRMTAVCRGA
jgi:glycerophosphoryl diester phosphodiesterase